MYSFWWCITSILYPRKCFGLIGTDTDTAGPSRQHNKLPIFFTIILYHVFHTKWLKYVTQIHTGDVYIPFILHLRKYVNSSRYRLQQGHQIRQKKLWLPPTISHRMAWILNSLWWFLTFSVLFPRTHFGLIWTATDLQKCHWISQGSITVDQNLFHHSI